MRAIREDEGLIKLSTPRSNIFQYCTNLSWNLIKYFLGLLRILKSWAPETIWRDLEIIGRELKIKFATVTNYDRRKIRAWVRTRVTCEYLEGSKRFWRNGVLLCAVVDSVLTGSCPQPDILNSGMNIKNTRLALQLIEKHFGLKSMVTAEELCENNEAAEEKAIILLSRVMAITKKQKFSTSANRTPLRTLSVPYSTFGGNRCMAKGMGLFLAVKGRWARFNIFYECFDDLDILLEILGPMNTQCSQRIRKIPAQRSEKESAKTVDHEACHRKIPLQYEVYPKKICISYMPLEDGKHKLFITWRGQHVLGSPYTVSVDKSSKSPEQMSPQPGANMHFLARRTSRVCYHGSMISASNNMIGIRKGTLIRRRVLRYIISIAGKDVVVENRNDLCAIVKGLKEGKPYEEYSTARPQPLSNDVKETTALPEEMKESLKHTSMPLVKLPRRTKEITNNQQIANHDEFEQNNNKMNHKHNGGRCESLKISNNIKNSQNECLNSNGYANNDLVKDGENITNNYSKGPSPLIYVNDNKIQENQMIITITNPWGYEEKLEDTFQGKTPNLENETLKLPMKTSDSSLSKQTNEGSQHEILPLGSQEKLANTISSTEVGIDNLCTERTPEMNSKLEFIQETTLKNHIDQNDSAFSSNLQFLNGDLSSCSSSVTFNSNVNKGLVSVGDSKSSKKQLPTDSENEKVINQSSIISTCINHLDTTTCDSNGTQRSPVYNISEGSKASDFRFSLDEPVEDLIQQTIIPSVSTKSVEGHSLTSEGQSVILSSGMSSVTKSTECREFDVSTTDGKFPSYFATVPTDTESHTFRLDDAPTHSENHGFLQNYEKANGSVDDLHLNLLHEKETESTNRGRRRSWAGLDLLPSIQEEDKDILSSSREKNNVASCWNKMQNTVAKKKEDTAEASEPSFQGLTIKERVQLLQNGSGHNARRKSPERSPELRNPEISANVRDRKNFWEKMIKP